LTKSPIAAIKSIGVPKRIGNGGTGWRTVAGGGVADAVSFVEDPTSTRSTLAVGGSNML